jgi:hypothetical protein
MYYIFDCLINKQISDSYECYSDVLNVFFDFVSQFNDEDTIIQINNQNHSRFLIKYNN